MKKRRMIGGIIVLFAATGLLGVSCSAKQWYVSAQGDDANNGTLEQIPYRTLSKAITSASHYKKNIITVVGVLDAANGGDNEDAIFVIRQTGKAEITITGMANAPEGQRAVLSGAGKELPIVRIEGNSTVRFENIEISGALDNDAVIVTGESTLILGKGVKISDNSGAGITVEGRSNLIMESGEITKNGHRGVYIDKDCTFTMADGQISHNTSDDDWHGGGGVFIGGIFTMEGGTISENLASSPGRGGGVCVFFEAEFLFKGGLITNNKSEGYTRRGFVGNGGGGGLVVYGDENGKTKFTMEGGEISGNTAERYGGAILFNTDAGGGGTFTMTGGKITGNTARGGGGYQNYGDRFTITVNGGDISGNTPDDVDKGWNW